MELIDIQLFLKQNITHTLSYLGAIQGVILAIIVWNYPRQHKTSNRILSIFLLILAHLLIAPRIMEAVDSNYTRLIYGIRFLAPISLFLYIQSLYKPIDWKKQYWHLIIILLDFLVLYAIIEIKISTLGDDPIWESIGIGILGWGWFILIYCFYMPLTFRVLQKYKKKVLRNFSSLHNLGLKWGTQVFFGFLGLIIIDVIVGIFSLSFPEAYSPYHGLVNTIAYTAFMYFVTIKGKLTPQIYKLRKLRNKPVPPLETKIINESRSLLKEKKELTILSQQVLKIIEEEKLYKEMGLSVNEVAEKIGAQAYLVSQAINSCLGKNFFELINRYRVEEAKKLLVDNSLNHLSIVGIAFEAGFNSKTAFNTSFKKYTGKTPSEFKKKDFQEVAH